MKKFYSSIIAFILTASFVIGQTSVNSDTSQIKIRGTGTYFVDGFKVYTKLTKADSITILKYIVSKLNGCWTSDKQIHSFNLSDKTFSGGWNTRGIHSTAPFVRLEFVNGQIKLIVTDVIGGDGRPRNIKVDEKKVTIEYPDDTNTFHYKRLKNCP